tara:strand:+ start:486 stop:2012 length:1527 start_codon:yes stop_codon:yes gene_type:complete
MTRASRQIDSIIRAGKILKEEHDGKENTRALQDLIGERLAEEGTKTKPGTKLRKDSGGSRTWIVGPKTFGLCFEEEENGKMEFTDAGNIVAKGGRNAITMMEIQLLRFQWPNRTQDHHSQKMSDEFKIFPYRFLLKLLCLVNDLSVQEIEYFILPVTSAKQLDKVSKNIRDFRKGKIILDYDDHRKKFRQDHDKTRYRKYINDLANTFKNHLEFFDEIDSKKVGNINRLHIEETKLPSLVKKINLADSQWNFIDTYEGQPRRYFVHRYGLDPNKKKASPKTSKPVTKEMVRMRKICEAIYEIQVESPESISLEDMKKEIRFTTNLSMKDISKVLSNNPELYKTGDVFGKKYLEVAGDGNRHEEFEIMTNQILKKIGFDVKAKVTVKLSDEQEGEIDTLVTYNSESGVIDEKAGKNFSCGNERVGPMENYIREARKISDTTKVKFFGYVYGRKFSTPGGFNRIREEMKIDGFRISASNLYSLFTDFHKEKISKEEIWNLFKSNGEISNW